MFEKLKLSPGLITLRYTTPAAGTADAVIRPFIPLGARGALSLMFEPGNVAGALTQPGQMCIIRCLRSALLGLEILRQDGGEQPNGGIEIDYLSRCGEEPEEPGFGPDLVVCFDHFGDRPARFGAWVSGEAAGQAVSGLLIRPRALAARIMLRDPVSDQIAAPGDYLGSRRGFRPLSGLEAWLDAADGRHRLHMQADFAEAGRVEARGTLVSLHGAGPHDRLLRLNMAVEAVQADPAAMPVAVVPARPDRLRIFRKA